MARVKLLLCLAVTIGICQVTVSGQTNPRFNVNLSIDYKAADQTIALLEGQMINTETLAKLRANRIAAATTGLIADRAAVPEHLQGYLDSLKFHSIIRDDVYHLEAARHDVGEIKDLFLELIRRSFNRKVVATVEQVFPPDAEVDVVVPVYIVALGHENVDAYVRRINWHGDFPEFVGDDRGELTIVINLAHAIRFGNTTEERFINLLGVAAHEVFHAAFSAYKETSPVWKAFRQQHQTYTDELLDLTQNEGIAYYLSMEEQGHGRLPREWESKTPDVFSAFNKNSVELLSKTVTPQRASELLRAANLSGFWESYGAITGMFIAREIDLQLGRAALIETIRLGPYDFFNKYVSLTARGSALPPLSREITAFLSNP